MNKVYKVIWSNTRKCYVVVSEIAKNRGKNNTRSILNRLASLAAAGALLAALAAPTAVWAQNIEKAGGAKFNDTVNHIYADKVIDSTAVNAFENFQLDKGHIANMYMGMQANPNAATSLVNFVNNQASINGTVNAIRNNGIGGNLYFLSPNGVIVGSTGVINAGSVNLMAPTQSFYNTVVGANGVKETAFRQNWGDIQKGTLPLNPEGTITVSGKINAVDGVQLRAGNVNIKSGAKIENKDSLDFASLVNVSGADSGLSSDKLKLSKSDSSGKITVAAVGNNSDEWDVLNIELKPEVTVEKGAAIEGDGEVNLSASAKNTGSMMISSLSATVDVNGTVTGDTVDISATAEDEFALSRASELSELPNGQLDLPTVATKILSFEDIDLSLAIHKASATVNIGKDAVVTATGKDTVTEKDGTKEVTRALNISAESGLSGAIATDPDTFTGEILDIVKEHFKWKQGAQNTSIGVGVLENNATVNVKGKLATTDAEGGARVAASAPMEFEGEVTNTIWDGQDNTFLAPGVGVVASENHSHVNLEKSAGLTGIAGDFEAAAKTENNLSLSVDVKGMKDKATIATTVAVLAHDSSADVKDDTKIKAANVSLDAANTVKKLSVKAKNGLGSGDGTPKNTGLFTTSDTYMSNLKYSIVGKITGKEIEEPDSVSESLQELFNAGASVNVTSASNTAGVTLTPNAAIDASGDVSITGKVSTNSLRLNANGSAGNAKQHKIDDEHSESKQEAKVEASVIVADMDNSAEVLIGKTVDEDGSTKADGSANSHAVIKGKKVSIGTENTFTYDNIEKMEKDLKDAATAKSLREAGPAVSEAYDALVEAWDAWKEDKSTFGKVTDSAAQLLSSLGGITSGISDLAGITKKVTAFADPASYGTFYVGPKTSGGKLGEIDPTANNSKFAVAGAADIAVLTDTSQVTVGKYAQITATDEAAFTSTLTRDDTSVNGVLGLMNSGDQNAVGGIFSLYDADRTAKVDLGENASVTGSAVSAKADKDTSHLSVAAGAGKGGNTGITAMVAMVQGTDTAAVNVGDGASLKALNGGKVALSTDNDTQITNIAGSLGIGTSAGIGASVAVTDVNRQSLLSVGRATVTGGSADFFADNGGMLNTAAVAGGVVANDDTENVGKIAKFQNWVQNQKNKVSNVSRKINDATKKIIPDKLKSAMDVKDNKMLKTDNVAKNPQAGKELPSISIGGAGSVAISLGDADTKAEVKGATVTLAKDSKPGDLSVHATDTSYTGAYAGAAGIAWNNHTGANNENSRTVGVAGAVGWVSGENTVLASVKDSTVTGSIDNKAEKSGAGVGAGLGLALAKGGSAAGSSTTAAAASLSVVNLDNTVKAELENDTVKQGASVSNQAVDSDTLVSGGVNASISLGKSKGTAVGGSVTVNIVKNDVDALITGGSYNLTGDLRNTVSTNITEVGGAIGVAVASSSGSGASAYGIEGVAAYNGLTNDAVAKISGATVTAKNVTVDARDSKDNSKKYDEYINKSGLDATGSTYAENLKDALDDGGKADISSSGGNTIVSAAVGVAASVGEGGAGAAAAAAISEVDNDFTASIADNSKITLNNGSLAVKADSKTLAVNAAAGGGGSSDGWGVGGSFSWQTDANTVTAKVENAEIQNAAISVIDAGTSGKDINVAGQVAAGQKAVGLAGSYNRLENTTQALSTNAKFTGSAARTLSVGAHNEGRVYAVTAGVALSREGAANGAVAVNSGAGNIKAELSGGFVENASSVSVTSKDDTKKLAVAGGFTASMGAAIGGAVAYNAIGDTDRQVNSAAIKNAAITGKGASQLNVSATDESGLTTIGFGTSLALGKPAVNGAAAVGLANRDVTAGISGSTLTNMAGGANVKASTDGDFSTTAAVVSVGESVAAGVGVAVTRDNTHTTSTFSGGSFTGGSFAIDANSHSDITTVGVGGGVNYGSGLGLAGSVAVNTIGTETKALVNGGAKVSAAKSPSVTAASDEKIANYAGTLSISAQGAAIGASVSVNEIGSETEAAIEGAGTEVGASADTKNSATDTVDDKNILNNFVDKDSFDSAASLKDSRQAKNYNGILVDASATHTMKSFLVNVGGTGEGAAVNGTVNVNLIGGSTKAKVENAKVNSGKNDKSGVNVIAHDYTNSAGIVGTANLAGIGAAVGLGSDTNKVARTTEASLVGPAAKYDLNANDVNIEAKSRQGIASLAAGGSVAGEGAGISAATGVTLLDGDTNAFLKNVNIKNAKNITVAADHLSRSHVFGAVLGGAGIGAGIGISVGYIEDAGTTEATVENVTAAFAANKKSDLKVDAKNELSVDYREIGVGGAGLGAGVAGSVGITDANSTAKATLKNSTIGTTGVRAKNANITAENKMTMYQRAGVGSAGAAGVGVGVSVNKLDSTTSVTIDNSKIYANAITAGTNDSKTVDQMAANAGVGGAAIGLNVMVTNVGKDIAEEYDAGDGETKMKVGDVFKDVNDAMGAGNLSEEETHGVAGNDGKALTNSRGTITRASLKKDSASGLTVTGSTLDSAGDVTLQAGAAIDAELKSYGGSAGGSVAANGSVAILDAAANTLGEVRDSTVKGGSITIAAYQGGLSQLEVKQGAVSGTVALSGAYGSVTRSGLTDMQLSGNSMNATDIAIAAVDESRAKIDALGASGAVAGSVNVLIGEVTNKGKVTVSLQGGNSLAASDSLLVAASRSPEDDKNSAEITTTAVSAAIGVAGAGISAQANDESEAAVTVNTQKNTKANSLKAKTLGITALNSPKVSTETKSAAASLLVSASVTEANAAAGTKSAPVKSTVSVGDGTSLLADDTQILAQTDIGLSTDMKGLGISGYVAAQVNTGRADAYGDSNITLGKVNVQKDGNLFVMSYTDVTKDIKAAGVSAAGLVASGTNVAKSESVLNSSIDAAGTDGTELDLALLLSTASEDNTARADGDGGAAVDISPYAAKLENSLTTNTKTNVKGNWNSSLFAAGADLTDKHDFTTDATRAAIAGGSGVGITNTANHTTAVNVNNANVTTDFTQGYKANNTIDYTDTQKAGSYGGVTGSDSAVKNTVTATADVNITGGTLKGLDESSVRAQAKTVSNIVSKNNVEGAGVVQILVGSSDTDTSFTDRVTVTDANLSTESGDISLAATSEIDHDLEAESVDEGGASGVTTVKNTNKLTRRDKVNVTGSSKIDSGHDLMLLAGADENKIASNLRLLTYANAHNATFIPAETSPEISETLTLDRGVTVGSNANTTSIRHTYLRADEGTAYIEESARQFKIWGQGETGKRRLTSTALGDSEVSQDKTSKVDVQGKVTAGIHNQLDIDVDASFTVSGSGENASLNTEKANISAKQDWFDVKNAVKTITVINPYIDRYNEVLRAKTEYNQDSAEYKALAAEEQKIIETMKNDGFIFTDSAGNIAILAEIPVPGIAFSDINVSGGNVYIDGSDVSGDANISANGAPHVDIRTTGDKSNALMVFGNVKIEDGGGKIYKNDKIVKDDSADSYIAITHNGYSNNSSVSRPDIRIEGSVENLSGSVKLSNLNGDIDITGSVNGRTVDIEAGRGAVRIDSPDAFVNVGGDPILKYQFSEETAAKIQKKISDLAAQGTKRLLFKDYDEYRSWLKNTVGLSDAEMQYTFDEKAGYIAGGSINIAAKDVNINGLIQSGYTSYKNTITASDLAKITAPSAGNGLADDDVIGNQNYLVGKSGTVWNSTSKTFDYNLPVYYNPTTRHLLTGEIDVRGGRVDIKGNIYSTGNGRIVAADGPADISIDASKTAGVDLYVGRIANNDREGLIRINNTNNETVIERKINAQRVGSSININQADWEANPENQKNIYSAFGDLPVLQWTGGTSGQTIKDMSYKKYYASLFGIVNLWEIKTTNELIDKIGSDYKNVQTTVRSTAADGTMARGVTFTRVRYGDWTFAEREKTYLIYGNAEHQGHGILIMPQVYNTGGKTLGKVNASEMTYTNGWHTSGYITYKWTETQGNTTSSSTFINASRPISLEFNQAKSGGAINLGSGGNVYFMDNVESAANLRDGKTDTSGINVTATGDVKTMGSARLLTGSLTASGKYIDLAHSAIADSSTIDLTSKGGNIAFVSDKGDLAIKNAVINNAPSNGTISITADGNIVNAGQSSLISAPAILLASENGGIGASGSPLRVKAGSTVTSSNLLSSSLTATARKDINMVQTEGDMRIAKIESKEGDVTLEAKTGSIVDANGGAYTDDSSAEARLARWKELGMISDADGDDSHAEAAKASKAKRLGAIEGRFAQLASTEKDGVVTQNAAKVTAYKNAANAYAKDSGIVAAKKEYISAMQAAATDAARDAARAKLQAAKDAYFTGKGFTAEEQRYIADYGDLSVSDNYGWSKNELLYAVQDGIVNAKPGTFDLVNTPNVSGKNITLLAPNGGIGNDEAAKYIKNEDITKAENMKLLASSRAGDLTWDGNGVTIRRQVPITIDVAEGGEVQLNGNKNVYVSATADSALNLKGGIDTDGDIRLSAGKGIAIADGTMIRGRNLTLLGGAGDIGASNKYLEMMINGWLMANSGNSVYVHQNGNVPLTLLSVAAGMDSYLHADNGIRMYNGYGMDMGYINAGRTVDLFTKQGDIEGIRILATDAAVNAAAEGRITLVNVGGELKLADIFDASKAEEYKKKKQAVEEARKKAAEEEARKQAEAETLQKLIAEQTEAYMDFSIADAYLINSVAYRKYLSYKEKYDKNGNESDKKLYEEQLGNLIDVMQRDNYGGRNYSREELALIVQYYYASTTEGSEAELAAMKSQFASLAQTRVKADPAASQKAAEETVRQKAEEAARKQDETETMQKLIAEQTEAYMDFSTFDDYLKESKEYQAYQNARKKYAEERYAQYGETGENDIEKHLGWLIDKMQFKNFGGRNYTPNELALIVQYYYASTTEGSEAEMAAMKSQFASLAQIRVMAEAEQKAAAEAKKAAAQEKAAAARAEQEAAKAAEEEATRAKQEAAKAAEAEAAAAEEARNEARRQQAAASCFVAGSPVATTDGERPISELAVGDRVITLDRDGKETVGVVTEVMTPREAEIVEVTFSNGAVWRTTESQTVWLGHEQNYEIKDDAVGKKALLRGGESVAVTSVKYTGKYETVYDVLVGEEEDEDVIFVAGIAAEGYFTKGERGR